MPRGFVCIPGGEEITPGYSGDAVAQLPIGLVPSARGMGGVRKLLDRLLDEARSLGLGEVQLTVGLANVPAVKLYQRVGFSILESHGRSARMICEFELAKRPRAVRPLMAEGDGSVVLRAAVRRRWTVIQRVGTHDM